MTIDDKYCKLLGKSIYNKRLDKYGYLASLEIRQYISGNGICFIAFYDAFDDHELVFLEDFKKGEIQFVIIDEVTECYIDDIKQALEDDFANMTIIHISDKEWKANVNEQKRRNVVTLFQDLTSLTHISAEVIVHDFYAREIYLKYTENVITKEEMLYAMINHLAQQLKRVDDRNTQYFLKYEFLKETLDETK